MRLLGQYLGAVTIVAVLLSIALHVGFDVPWGWALTPVWIVLVVILLAIGIGSWLIFNNFLGPQ